MAAPHRRPPRFYAFSALWGVWGVFGAFGFVFGSFAAVFGGLEASWGDFGPILSLLATPDKANVLIPDSARGPPELCFLQISCSTLPCVSHALRPASRGRRILRVRAGSGDTRGIIFG